ncbi:MAG: DUF1501 domain-containing protein [Acidimicrobiales bacterium]
MPTLSRRRFLGLTGIAAAGGAAAWAGLLRERLAGGDHFGAGRILVLVQCGGGNDGLNTLVPAGAGRYRDARPSLAPEEDRLIAVPGNDRLALHPALGSLRPLWEAGSIAALQGIGYEQRSRSHFQSMQAWWTGDPTAQGRDGWLGRWLRATGAADDNPLAAVVLGGGPASAVRAEGTVSTVVSNLRAFRLRAPGPAGVDAVRDALLASARPLAPDPTLSAAQQALPDALNACALLSSIAPPNGSRDEDGGPEAEGERAGAISAGLDAAARLVALDGTAGLGIRVIAVGGGGFDTHANQAGTHAALLADLAGGIAGFFEQIEATGDAERVLLVTTSEFGRRVAENGSGGTDHGAAGVQFIAGVGVRGGVVGDVDLGHLVDGDLRPTIDVRSLYSVALDWLGGPVDEVVGRPFDGYGILRP